MTIQAFQRKIEVEILEWNLHFLDEGEVMDQLEYIVPCHFGLEAVMKREILDLGYEIARVEDGREHSGAGLRLSHGAIFFCGQPNGYCLK